MPKLVKREHIAALREQVARMSGSIAEMVEALNAPEVLGHETGAVATADAYEALSPSTMLALDAEAGSGAGLAGEAIWLLSALADVEPLSLASGSRGAGALAALTDGGIIPAVERDALLAAAQEPMLTIYYSMASATSVKDPDSGGTVRLIQYNEDTATVTQEDITP